MHWAFLHNNIPRLLVNFPPRDQKTLSWFKSAPVGGRVSCVWKAHKQFIPSFTPTRVLEPKAIAQLLWLGRNWVTPNWVLEWIYFEWNSLLLGGERCFVEWGGLFTVNETPLACHIEASPPVGELLWSFCSHTRFHMNTESQVSAAIQTEITPLKTAQSHYFPLIMSTPKNKHGRVSIY